MSYDQNSIQAMLGDGFRDYVTEELNKRGCQFQPISTIFGHSLDLPKYDKTMGDLFSQDLNIFLECKAAFEKYKKNVSIGVDTRNVFVGNNRYYVTAYGNSTNYHEVKFFKADDVKKQMINTENDAFFGIREGKEDGKITKYQLFNHFSIIPFAIGFDDFVAKIKSS